MAGDRPAPGPTPATPSRSCFGAGVAARARRACCGRSALRRVLLVTTAGRLDSDDGERVRAAIGRALASTFAEVAVARAGAARAGGGAAGPARRRRRRRVASAAARAPTWPRRCASSPSRRRARPARRSPTARRCPHVVDPHDLLGRRAHAVLRHDRPRDPAEERRRRPDDRADRGGLRPRADAVDAGPGQRRDRHERAGPLRRGGRGRRSAPPRPRPSRSPAPGASSTRCPRVVDDPPTSTPATDMLAGAVLGRPVPPERARWACTTGCPSSSAAAPASPTASPTP